MNPSAEDSIETVTIAGAGLAGTLLAVLLARRGRRVRLYERLPDMRRENIPAGRSINLALAARGIRALEMAGVMDQVQPLLIPMPGRLLHALDGTQSFVRYGQREHEVIHSVSRPGLNRVLLDAAERASVEIHFRCPVIDARLHEGLLVLREESTRTPRTLPLTQVIAADGAGSILRRALVSQTNASCSEDLLEHGYKELRMPPGPRAAHRMEKHALHIWPRGGFMLIALPNVDGSFTVTLFLPQKGAISFESLADAGRIRRFFQEQFPDACALMPCLAEEFLAHPTGIMGTVRCARWTHEHQLLLIGDAAHAITPFHGQGMNCALEDCRELAGHLSRLDRLPPGHHHDGRRGDEHRRWAQAFRDFENDRRPHANAIADMALENYVEMRDTVRDPAFQLQKTLSLALERRFPQHFVPRYSMVMFHPEIPYAEAFERGRIQNEILDELMASAATIESVDYQRAARLIEERLTPIPTMNPR